VLGKIASIVLCFADRSSMSNGGGFIGTVRIPMKVFMKILTYAQLACDAVGSKLFNALASHSGAFYTDVNGPENGCSPAVKIPMLEIHGVADKTVKYEVMVAHSPRYQNGK
jgi:hypothetical protein